MITLTPFTSQDFERLRSWVGSADELTQFAGIHLSYPLTDEQLENYLANPKRIPFNVLLAETDECIGHCGLNFEKEIPRLSRILIGNKEMRGKGIGKLIVTKLLEKLFIEDTYSKADLAVYDWNTAAIKCYESVGFVVNPDVTYKRTNECGDTWTAINMVISKEEWIRRRGE